LKKSIAEKQPSAKKPPIRSVPAAVAQAPEKKRAGGKK
jgi:hypothetical protein